ncbi:hypothetical protein PPBDW_I20865 [Photobacterium kishitanii]|nr:hypothetical protein PPBDW_I20865 [Photobacterium kishitanii]
MRKFEKLVLVNYKKNHWIKSAIYITLSKNEIVQHNRINR